MVTIAGGAGDVEKKSRVFCWVAIALAAVFVLVVVFSFLPADIFSSSFIEGGRVKVEENTTLFDVARLLESRSFIFNKYLFAFYAILVGDEKKIQAGIYLIPPSPSTHKILTMMTEGKTVRDLIWVRVPEGSNISDIDEIFAEAGLTRGGDFLKPEFIAFEGYLFPDTYIFKRPDEMQGDQVFAESDSGEESSSVLAAEIVEKMRENFNKKTVSALGQLGLRDLNRIIIIASILEKEVRAERDMKLVAGVIENRLNRGMKLQIDATTAYGACYPEFLEGHNCNVALANIVDNLKSDSVYNTYVKDGLPPAPISNPGLKAIDAVLNPEPSDFLYYLSAKDGTTIFSKTGAEHEKNRAKYLNR